MASSAQPPTQDSLSWTYNVPLITNRFILWDAIRILVICVMILDGLIFIISVLAGDPLMLPIEFTLLIVGIVAGLLFFVALVIFGNRYYARYTLNAKEAVFEGIGWGPGGWHRLMKGLLKIVAFFSLRSDPTEGQGAVSIKWRDVRKVNVHHGARVISLHNSWRTVIRLQCPPEIFDQVIERVQTYATNVTGRNT